MKNDATTVTALAHGTSMAIETADFGNVIRLFSAEGTATLSILVTPAGPVLRFGGTGLAIETEGDIGLSARKLALHGREGIALTTGGDLEIRAEGDLHSVARIQTIVADLGNVNVKANDDLKLDGERVLVNCD